MVRFGGRYVRPVLKVLGRVERYTAPQKRIVTVKEPKFWHRPSSDNSTPSWWNSASQPGLPGKTEKAQGGLLRVSGLQAYVSAESIQDTVAWLGFKCLEFRSLAWERWRSKTTS